MKLSLQKYSGLELLIVGSAVTFAVGGGMLASKGLVFALPVVPISILAILIGLRGYTERLFVGALALLLIGFLFQGRAFAYVGFPPLFVSEVVLALGLVAVLFSRVRMRISTLQIWTGLFVLLGVARTVPYVPEFGIMAIRDAALWYYALFALLVAWFLNRSRLVWFMEKYARLLPFLVILYSFMLVMRFVLGDAGIRLPGSDMVIPSAIKAGDRAVFLSGMAVFVSASLIRALRLKVRLNETIFWMAWFVAVASVVVQNRGGFLALLISVGAAQLLLSSRINWRMLGIGISFVTILLLVNPTIDLGGSRSLSVEQIRINITSIFSDDTDNLGSVQGTRQWRLNWWGQIAENTLGGPLTLGGHGFGVNLADVYGFQVLDDGSLRSPHNSHITVLARMGAPGAIIWVALQLTFAYQMVRSFYFAQRNDLKWAPVLVWLLAIWLAAMVNSSFDVYLEGPQGAVPFWCVFGAGMAVMNWVREDLQHKGEKGVSALESVART